MLKPILNIVIILILLFPVLSNGQDVNPFDVIHKGDISELPDLPPPVTEPADFPEDEVPVETDRVDTMPGELVHTEFENIFDVDHIPLNAEEIVKTKSPESPPPVPEADIDVDPVEPSKEESTGISPVPPPPIKELVDPVEKEPRPLARNVVFVILFLTLLIVTIVINIKRKTFVNLYRSIFNDNYLNLVQREENNGNSIFFLLLYIAFFLNTALFIHLMTQERNIANVSFLFVLLAIIGIYFIRHLSLRIMASVFPFQKVVLQFNFTIIVFNCLIGIIIFPLNAFYAYSPFTNIIFFLGISVFIFFYLIRQLRGFFLAMRISGLNLFHFFIYLCTCEIAPVLIIINFITDYSSAI